MKRLGLLRHAKSDWDDRSLRDFDRGLNDRGRRGAALIGEHIQDHGMRWDRLIASPAVRVKETLRGAQLGIDPIFDERLYLASTDTIAEILADQAEDAGDAETILLVGHNPGLQDMVLELVSPSHENDLFREASTKFPTATFAILECDIENWAELKNHCAKLIHFARPRDLDPELGPEV